MTSAETALDQALRALRHRDRTATEIDHLLESRGVEESDRQDVLERLVRTALVDDERYAASRARALADRGAGNERIRYELARAGVVPEIAEVAIGSLDSESERAARVVARRGASVKTARYLAGKGFSDDVVHAAVARARDEPLG
jgi:regulatory protein